MATLAEILADPRWDELSRVQRAEARPRLFKAYLEEDPKRTAEFVRRDEAGRQQLWTEFVDRLQEKYAAKFSTPIDTTTVEPIGEPGRRRLLREGRGRELRADGKRVRTETVNVPVLDPESEQKLQEVHHATTTQEGTGFEHWSTADYGRLGAFADVLFPGHAGRAMARPTIDADAVQAGLMPQDVSGTGVVQSVKGALHPVMKLVSAIGPETENRRRIENVESAYEWLQGDTRFESAGAVAALAAGGSGTARALGSRLLTRGGIATMAAADLALGAAYAEKAPGFLATLANDLDGKENPTRTAILSGLEAAGIGALAGVAVRRLTIRQLKDYARTAGWEGTTDADLRAWYRDKSFQRAKPVHVEPIDRTLPAGGQPQGPAATAAGNPPPAPASAGGRPSPPQPPPAPPPVQPGAEARFTSRLASAQLPEQMTGGAETTVLGARGLDLPGRYVYAPRALVQASHVGPTFSKNPEYPLENTRDYANLGEQEKVLNVRNGFDPRRHVTDSPDAAVGPAVVAHVVDEQGVSRLVVLGGNNREMAIGMLDPARAQELHAYTASRAERFGLPPPTEGQALYRFVGDFDLRQQGTRAKLQNVIDALNPAPGKVQNISEQARVDADNNVPVERLAGMAINPSPAAAQETVRQLLREGALDRNLRGAFAETGAQAQSYVNHLLLHGAYRLPSLVDARMDSRAGEVAVVRGMIDAGVRPTLQLRLTGRADVADAIGRTFWQVARAVTAAEDEPAGKRRAKAGAEKRSPLVKALADLSGQQDIDPTMAVVRELAAALGRKVVRGKGGAVVEGLTVDGMADLLDDIARALELQGPGPDLFGGTPDAADTIRRAIAFHFGSTEQAGIPPEAGTGLEGAEALADQGAPTAAPAVNRHKQLARELRDLRKREREKPLTPTEYARVDTLEAELGQAFMSFYTPHPTPAAGGPSTGSGVENDPQLRLFERQGRYREAENQLHLQLGNDLETLATGQPPGASSAIAAAGGSPDPDTGFGPGATLRGLAFTRQLASDGIVRFTGLRIANVDELVRLAQTLRNPRFETFYIFGLKNGVILPPYAVSSRLPSSTRIAVGDGWEESIADYLDAVGADGYYALHNHPSGELRPSEADLQVTRELPAAILRRMPALLFHGHVIIDHFRYNHLRWRPDHGHWVSEEVRALPEAGKTPDQLLSPELKVPGLGVRINGPDEAAIWGKTFVEHREGFVTIALMDVKERARAVLEVHRDRLLAETFEADLRKWARDLGSTQAVAYYARGDDAAVTRQLSFGVDQGWFHDAFAGDRRLPPPLSRGRIGDPNKLSEEPGPPRPAYRLQEDPEEFKQPAHAWFEIESRKPGDAAADKGHALGRRGTYLPIVFRDLDKIRTIEMPEAVALIERLLGSLPKILKMPGALGSFMPRGRGRISLDPRIFVDSSVAVRVLLHELGHAVDYLPDRLMQRGNLLGRLATLRNYLQQTIDLKPVDPSQALTRVDYARLRRQAQREAGTRPPDSQPANVKAWQESLKQRYAQLVEAEIKRRKLAKADVIYHELWELTNWWKPIPPDAPQSYVDYRRSGVELYADALSVLFNSPADLFDRAPTFWRMWFDYLDRKPAVKKEFFDLQDLLTQPYTQVLGARLQRIEGMFAKGEEILWRKWEEREAAHSVFRGWWDRFRTEFDNVYWPIVKRAREAKAKGAKLEERWDPEVVFGEHPLSNNHAYVWLQRLHEKVIAPMEAQGLTIDHLGRYLFLNRVLNEVLPARGDLPGGRSQLANPLGMTPEAARLQLLQMRLNLGLEQMTALDRYARGFQDLLFAQVELAVRLGNYPAAALPTLRANRYNYATFAVLDFFDPYVPSGLKRQKGTFAPIANPFTASVLKTLTLIRATQMQYAKVTAAKLLREHFPAEIRGLRSSTEPLKPTESKMSLMVNGRPVLFALPTDVVRMFEGVTPADASAILGALNWAFRKLIYPLWITYNPAFQFFTSPMRDFQRAFVNLPRLTGARMVGEYLAHLGTLGVEGVNALVRAGHDTTVGLIPGLHTRAPQIPVPMTQAARLVRALLARRVSAEPGRQPPGSPHAQDAAGLAREMLLNSAIGTPLDAFATHRRTDSLGKLMEQMRLLPEKARWKILERGPFAVVRALLQGIEFAGLANEMLPKAAAYRILAKELGRRPRQTAEFIRNHVGVPNFHEQGRSTRLAQSVFPFLQVFAKGYQHDFRLAAGKGSAFGWWMRWAATSGLWSILQALAKLGIFGAAVKLLYDRISDYNNTNYTTVPLGEVQGGDYGAKTVFFRIPRDETHRLLSGVVYKSIVTAGGEPDADLNDIFSFGAGQVPGLNPLLDIGSKWVLYLGGQNPRDSFRGRDLLPPQVHAAGGPHAFGAMMEWTYNQTGLTNFVKIDPGTDSWTEFSLDVLPGVNRLVQVSDYGLRERQWAEMDLEQAARARARLSLSDTTQRTLGEYYTLRSLGDLRTEQQTLRWNALRGWYNKAYKPREERMLELLDAGDAAGAADVRKEIDATAASFRDELQRQ